MKFVLVEFPISKFVLVEFSLCTTHKEETDYSTSTNFAWYNFFQVPKIVLNCILISKYDNPLFYKTKPQEPLHSIIVLPEKQDFD